MMSNFRLNRCKKRRALWLQVHLWLGLSAGLLLSVIGITGSISVFYHEIDEWLNPGVLTIQPDLRGVAAYQPLEKILNAAAKVAQPNDKFSSVQAPRVINGTYGVGYSRPANVTTKTPETWVSIRVNPYTAQVTGTRTFPLDAGFPPGLIDFIAVLHYRLLLSDFWGGTIVGVVGLIGLFSVMTGLILWWPLTGKIKQALTIKKLAGNKRLNFDIHKTFGVYLFLVLGAVLLSGVYMNFNSKFVGLVQLMSPGTNQSVKSTNSLESKTRIGLAKAAKIVAEVFPEGQDNWWFEDIENGLYVVSRQGVTSTSQFWAERTISLDAYTGRILNVRDANTRKTAGETFLDWQWPLHSGKAFGWTGRILVFISGLICPVLFITGILRWLQKSRVRRFSVKRNARLEATGNA